MTTTTENVIKIEDARELRELGLPILPIVDMAYSKAAEKLFAEAENSRARFYRAFVEYCRAPTKQRFNRMRKAIDKIDAINDRVAVFVSPQECEAAAVQAWFTVNVGPFVAHWKGVLASVENGEPVQVKMKRENFEGWALP